MVRKRVLQWCLWNAVGGQACPPTFLATKRRYSKMLEFSRYLSYQLRSGFLQRFPCDVTLCQKDYKYAAVRIDWERLWQCEESLWSLVCIASWAAARRRVVSSPRYCDVFPSRENRSHEKESPVPFMSAADHRTAAPCVVVKETFARVIASRRKATTMRRNQYLSESAYGVDFEEISGTLSCHTCIPPVVAKPKNLPHGWI
ncbi:hypothetical protein AVEN_71779-1 [Araneus ventricosus]|uniref:Uncharacterized protein n=1 Tax=Araneus ventricosus TaxID=182803 RepID=A0A4Y1ZP96_ARAVE|nr:hypothetical protein AVEN_71779-1 [Araneus ventricosus]